MIGVVAVLALASGARYYLVMTLGDGWSPTFAPISSPT